MVRQSTRTLLQSHILFTCLMAFLILSFVHVACKKKVTQVQFNEVTFVRGLDGCQPKQKDCIYVKMTYPEFTKGTGDKALDRLNRWVRDYLKSPLLDDKKMSPELMAKTMFTQYKAFKKRIPEAPGGWTVQRTVKVIQEVPKVLSLTMSQFSFLGGAHPNHSTRYLNLNPETGEVYFLKGILKPDFEKKLTAVGEKIFREQQKIPEDQNLGEAGYFFKDDKFALNNNFLITPNSLTFLFNPYEVAPYVVGDIKLEIPYSKIKDLIAPGSPLPH